MRQNACKGTKKYLNIHVFAHFICTKSVLNIPNIQVRMIADKY